MHIAVNIVLMIIALVSIVLHSLGSYLMTSLYKSGKQKTEQTIYMINLSITEILILLIELTVRCIPDLLHLSGSAKISLNVFRSYATILYYTCLPVVYYFTMIYISLDRLLEIVLNITYPLYWNTRRAKWLIIGTWFIGFALFVGFSITFSLNGYKYGRELALYLHLPLDIIFLVSALFAYGFIFRKFRQSRAIIPGRGKTNQPQSAWRVFLNSRFYVSVLLILSFLLFMVLPDIVKSFLGIFNSAEARSLPLIYTLLIMYQISIFCDAIINVFLQRSARVLLYKKLGISLQSGAVAAADRGGRFDSELNNL